MIEKLKDIISKMEGTLLAVGVFEMSIIRAIDNNPKIIDSYKLEDKSKITKEERKKGTKNVKFRKLKKTLKHKMDYVLCDVNGLNFNLRSFINNSYDLSNKQIIYFGLYDCYDVDILEKKYKRYNAKIKRMNFDNHFILIIDTQNLQPNPFVKLYYKIVDLFLDFIEAIGNGLMQ